MRAASHRKFVPKAIPFGRRTPLIDLRMEWPASAIQPRGDTLTLLIVGVVILGFRVASYTKRATWLACCSTAISMAVLVGGIFLSTAIDNQIRVRLTWLASQLPPVLGQVVLDDVTATTQQFSADLACEQRKQPDCVGSASRTASAVLYGTHGRLEITSPPPRTMQAAPTTGWREEEKRYDAAQFPVIWPFDEPGATNSSGNSAGLLITGINVSGEALRSVRGTLKPDPGQDEFGLTLHNSKNLSGK